MKLFTLSSSLSIFLEPSAYSKPCMDQLKSPLDSNRCMNTHSNGAQVRDNSCALNFCEDHDISAFVPNGKIQRGHLGGDNPWDY